MKNLLFSSIGLQISDHPIYKVSSENPTVIHVQMFASNEPPVKKDLEKSVDISYEEIKAFFQKTNTHVERLISYDMTEIEKNSVSMASTIIQTFKKYSKSNIVLELSTSRVPIKLALSRAGEIVYNYLQSQYQQDLIDRMPKITCVTRPTGKDIVKYQISNFQIPNQKDRELLFFLSDNFTKLSQTAISDKLQWKNQSEVSKSIQRIVKMGYLEKDNRSLTSNGKNLVSFLRNVS